MRKTIRISSSLAVSAAIALALGSCTYDPYYTVGGSYTSGYGSGYGYGSSGFSTSLFVSTGDPRWGYDPTCYSYYDYRRRCYYDPYLYGYYPVGYRPPVIIGVPHPHGYRRNYCPPPTRVTNVTLVNYNNREHAYRNSSYSWARQVRQQPVRQQPPSQPRGNAWSRPQYQPSQPTAPHSSSGSFWGNRGQAPSGGSSWNRGGSSQVQPVAPRPATRQPGLPPAYNVPIRTTPVPEPGISRPDRRSRPSAGEAFPTGRPSQPQRQVPQLEIPRPVPQPRPERSVPAPAPTVREAPSAPPPPAAPPVREVRGLGEGGGDSGGGRRMR
jgi:hypothetical protein